MTICGLRVSRADVASALTMALLVVAELLLVTVPMVTEDSSSVVQLPGGGTVTTFATTHRPVVSLGDALPMFIVLATITAAPLLSRRWPPVARAARIVVAALAVVGVLLTALSVGWLFLPVAGCALLAALTPPRRTSIEAT